MAARTTLWQAVERQRRRRAGMLVTLLSIWFVGASVSILLVLAAVNSLGLGSLLTPLDVHLAVVAYDLPQQMAVTALCSIVSGVVYVALTTRRSVLPHLISIDARPVESGESSGTLSALHDIAIAAGISPVPRLYVIPDALSVNAFVMGRTSDTPVIVVTEALVARGSIELKRAVFANLLARFRDGGVRWTTELFMIMGPIRSLLARIRIFSSWARQESVTIGAVLMAISVVGLTIYAARFYWFMGGTFAVRIWLLSLAVSMAVACLVTTLRMLDYSYRGAYRRLVYNADADGLMLLKDAEMAAAALKAVLNESTWLVGGWRYLYLAYVDAGDSIGHRASALEIARLDHLLALAFPARADTIRSVSLLRASETRAAARGAQQAHQADAHELEST